MVPSYEKSSMMSMCVFTRHMKGPNLSMRAKNSAVVETSTDAHKFDFLASIKRKRRRATGEACFSAL